MISFSRRPALSSSAPPARRGRRALPSPDAVLIVCTGNVCRSAYASRALQGRLAVLAPGRVEVGSAGSQPNQALTVPPPLVRLGAEAGVAGLADHRPAALQPFMVAEADLVLAAAQEHMRFALQEVPQAVARVFTVLELAALVRAMDQRDGRDWIPAGRGVRAFAAEAARHRALARSTAQPLDVVDPFRGPVEGYAEMIQIMDPALETIADALARAVTPTP